MALQKHINIKIRARIAQHSDQAMGGTVDPKLRLRKATPLLHLYAFMVLHR
jgi:hypothetical protein